MATVKAKKPGIAPGSLVYTGPPRPHPVGLTIFDYDESRLDERETTVEEAVLNLDSTDSVTWLNVTGVHDVETVTALGSKLKLHPLLLEDILHVNQRPKVEEFGDQLFIVVRMLRVANNGDIEEEQISFVLGKHYVVSFQEMDGDVFDMVRQRLRTGKGIIRKEGADYLTYALIDVLVDNYFLVLEQIGARMEVLEDEVMDNPGDDTMRAIRQEKVAIMKYRKAVWPLREAVSSLIRDGSGLIRKNTLNYLRDVYNHTVQVIDVFETYRELIAELNDLYLSVLGQRMNEIMKVLTVIGSVFIPLTFIAGIYGMNFESMPELGWKYGYPMVWGLMGGSTVLMLLFFKRKKWM